MTRKFTFLLMALLALTGFKSWGQNVITIGTEATTNQDIPFNGYYKYSYAQMLYLGSEIGESGTITSISFNVTQAVNKDYTLDVYMKCVDKSEYSYGDDWVSVTTDDLVYQTQFFNASTTGWKTITLDKPFQYNSDQNLMIAFDNNTGSYAGAHNFKTSYDGATCIYQRDDNLNISPFDPYGGSVAYYRPLIQITIEPAVSCPAPTGLAASNITATGATISWTDNGAESYDLAYGPAATFDLNTSIIYTLVPGLTETSVQLSGLIAETEYKCAVKAHCSDEEESAWSSAVAFLPSTFQHLTVNDGTYVNTNNDSGQVPFNGYNADNNYNKSQFVIPASALEQMADASITDITFYLNTNSSNKEYTYDIFDIYVKEVDYTTVGYTYPEEFASMTKVYTGKLTTSNYQLTIHFDEPYVYGGQNLMVGFNQTSRGTWGYTYWLGKEEGTEMRSRSGYSNSYGSTVNSYTFLPKTTFAYIPGATRYNVDVPESLLGGSVSANPTSATAGTLINLTATPTYECVCGYWNVYEFGEWIEYYDDVEIVNNQFTMPEHDVEIFVTFNPVSTYGINVNTFDEVTISATFDGWDIVNAPAGTIVTLSADLDEGYIFDYFTVDGIQISGNTFEMPDHAVTISAVFHEPVTYTITLHQNGAVSTVDALEGELLYQYLPAYVDVPCVVNAGWIANDIETYTIVKPELIDTYNTVVGSNLDLYAVFSYSEDVPVAKSVAGYWSKVTDPATLKNGDKVVFVYNDNNNFKIMCNRSGSLFDGRFNPGSVTVSDDVITTIPDNAVEFTLQSDGDNWKLRYVDALEDGETTLAYNNFDLYPKNYEYGTSFSDIWTAEINSNSVFFRETTCTSARYIAYNNGYFKGNAADIACQVYKAGLPYVTNTYYMTSVLTEGEVEDYVAKNIILDQYHQLFVTGTLELDANGLFRNTASVNDNFTFEDGAQFIYRGTEPINARFFKEIEAYSDAEGRDGYYLVANPTNNSDMSGWTFTLNDFDLYTFEGNQELEWINQHSNINFNRGTGYLFACEVETTLPFIGELLPAGSMNVALDFYTGTESGRDFPGFNLIGNPYACNAYVEGYNFYTMVDGELQAAGTTATVAPCEGFFVEATATGQSVSLSTTAPEAPASLLNITVSQNRGNVIDRAIVNFNDNNDLHKFMMNPAHTNLSIAKGGETFAAISTEAEGELPVSFKAEKNGSYTITVNTENVEAQYLHLIDNMTGADVDLLSSPSYTFNATTSDYASRFKLVFSMNNVENNQVEASCFAYISNGELIISNEGRATLQVIDVMGRIVRNQQIEGDARISTEGLTAGVYVLNLNGNVQKIVVR